MFDNVSKCAVGGGGGSPLVKAKSSPNVSKASLSSVKKQNQSNRTTNPTIAPVKPTRSGKLPITSRISIKMTNDTINSPCRGSNNSDSSKFRLTSPSKPTKRSPSEARPDTAKTVSSPARGNDKKKVCKSVSSSPSCTILEDRALLKKGLAYTPDKMPTKPEALQRKGTLDRSVSLNSVSVDSQTNFAISPRWIPIPLERGSVEKGKKAELSRKSPTLMNRSTSLWSVQTPKVDYNQCRKSYGAPARLSSVSRPSKIPLPAARAIGLGRSLADLSQVDRVEEPVGQMISFELDLDAATSDERIYENCRETLERASKLSASRISTSTSNLEERAARLMAQLENDLEPKEAVVSLDVAPPRRKEIVNEDREALHDSKTNIVVEKCNVDDESKDSPRVEEKSKRRKMTMDIFKDNTKTEEDAKEREHVPVKEYTDRIKNCEKPEEVAEKSRRNKETSIQELRRNWERQSKGNQDTDTKTIYVANSGKIVNLSKAIRAENDVVDDAQGAKRKQCVSKKANDIEHLVNFFNCKNAEVSKESSREALIKPRPANVPVIETPALKKNESKGANEYSGYTSDGNCSEDSGHISNENEVEWKENLENQSQKETNDFKGQQYFDRIDRDDNAKLFDSTIVRRLAEPEKKNVVVNRASRLTSCDDNSVDCCQIDDKCSESERQIFFRSGTLERLEAQRDEKLTGHIILLQARCRGYLARRKLNTLKLQDLAVRCIQRNVRKLMSVREWPWWRLYVKVAPLLNVHRTEDQLKARTEELELLRAKVERLEQERNHLKHDNDKLEAKLSEMTADFAEEHSTSTLAAERIDAETSERLRLERELQDVTETNKNLQQTTERLEMELLYARAADLNGIASDGEEGEDGGVYRQRYEHAIRELEFTKRKMAQQHEDDLEQLVGLKKQLEKKLADAYEEVEEQRQVVGQWKRRVQKLNGEMHDIRLLLEEQTARNNLLEKKQRKFDSETQNLMNDLRQEKAQRERLAREKEIAIAEKFTVEQNLSDARLEIELKEERLRTLTQELEELTFGGKTEEEVVQLKKAKHELEKRAKDQEEELDDLAGQVQLLEQAKLRLEMSIEQQRKEMRKEMQQRDEELEDVRGNAHKKVKALELQLENEHEERTILLREKHELERRLVALEEQDRADRVAEAETMQRLKRDLKRTKALLRDAQTMLERSKGDSTGKAALRQLKNQLEDAECARAVAIKAKQALEQELNETQASLEEAMRHRSEAEERANAANRERSELLSQLEENEEELAEVLKKYRAAVQQVSAEQGQLQEAQVQIAALEAEKSSLKDQLAELTQRLESVEQLGDPTANSLATRRLEFRAKELESKLELEQTTRARLETQIARLKESVDKLQTESALLRTKEQTAQDAARRLQRSLRDARDEASSAISREQEAVRARRDIEKSLEAAEAETKVARDDLRLALQRIDDLQSAIQGELDLDCSEEATSENSDSD
ncbi:PREDICTED: unconventional myosin-XVIIIa isoform X3 [Wasmannia auropunctata]|uniref:unconventional myosin-XVIIIa isoform X3 n=1 Tax=Wasmannia auropunctata TaxID=64793 RepID=UPI0005ED9E44|nr:PREDICTED: unconventional myosin-XVIIIa isoform X3 [Wasmannia auropunctata]XP_011687231.1 PREDICTED: unconventional myosin-XVIIIa isoform X3 [Wasmannia auropunctata]